MTTSFENLLTPDQLAMWSSLITPHHIQTFLDSIPYSPEERDRSPLAVLQDRQAHCLDGGLFAAAALRRIGYPPVIIDMLPEPGADDDHVLAIFRRNGCFGAIAKSNFSGLRYREPVYRTPRELVISYFDAFFNVDGERTLRAYTIPLHLASFDDLHWMWDEEGVRVIAQRLPQLRRFPLLTDAMARELTPVDERSYQAGMLGVLPAGLYKPHA